MTRHGSLAEQLVAMKNHTPKPRRAPPKPANDNRPARYRGTLPALRWLWDNRPDLAPALAKVLPREDANWFVDVEPSRQEIRPTVGELMAASHDEDGTALPVTSNGKEEEIGKLRFRKGTLVEWGVTKKGKKLKPTDRPRTGGDKTTGARNPNFYLSRPAIKPSPMDAEHYHRPFSGESALMPMYDPLPGVEAARSVLISFGVDGAVPARKLPFTVKFGAPVVAEGAGFLGGISSPSGNSSSGAIMWDTPNAPTNSATAIIEEVAARGTLKSIGMRLGFKETEATEGGKQALLGLAETLSLIRRRKDLFLV